MSDTKVAMSSRERDLFLQFAGAVSQIWDLLGADYFYRRADLIPYYKRDAAMLRKRAMKLFKDMCETIPNKQRNPLARDIESAKVFTVVRPVDKHVWDEDGRFVAKDDLKELADAAQEKCRMCTGMGEEYYKCKLRGAFDALPTCETSTDDERGGKCPYALLL